MNRFLNLFVVVCAVTSLSFYFVSINAYSGVYLGMVITALLSIIVIFFDDSKQIRR